MAFNDDFTTSLDARWTTFGPATIDSDASFNSQLTIVGAAQSSYASSGVYATAPSMPFTATCLLSGLNYTVQTYSDHFAALFVGEASPGKLRPFGLGNYSFSDMAIRSMNWTDSTTWASNGASTVATTGYGLHAPLYLKIVATSSSSIACSFSFDGLLWTLLESGVNPGFTIGTVGLLCQPSNQSKALSATFDWIDVA